jgi:WD40 repeat protein
MSYDGFISYSHAADDLLAPRLQSALQRFAKPWWKRRAVRIFRDESSLSANPHLWSSITEALDSSGWFVLLLSPDAAQSEWVNQEIAYWVDNRDSKRILPVVSDGSFGWAGGDVAGDAVPDALRGVFSEEPRWVDVRWAKDEDQLDLQDPRFADAVADIASTIRGIPKDDLASEEVRQHRRTIRTAWAAGGLVIALAVAAVGFGIASSSNAQLARSRELAASALAALDQDPELATLLALESLRGVSSDPPGFLVDTLWRAAEANQLVYSIQFTTDGGGSRLGVSPDGDSIVAVTDSGVVGSFDASTGEERWMLELASTDVPMKVAFHPDGEVVAVSIADNDSFAWGVDGDNDDLPNRVVILDTADGSEQYRIDWPDCLSAEAVGWSSSGELFAVSSGWEPCARDGLSEHWVEILDGTTFDPIQVLDTPEMAPFFSRIQFTDTDDLVAFGWLDTEVGVFEAPGYSLSRKLEGVTGVGGVTRDGSIAASFTLNRAVELALVDVGTTEQFDALETPAFPSPVSGITFSADGTLLAVATEGLHTHVFDVRSGKTLLLLPGGPALNAEFTADNRWAYTSHVDGTVKKWNLRPQTLGQTTVESLRPEQSVNARVAVEQDFGAAAIVEFGPGVTRSDVIVFDARTGEFVETVSGGYLPQALEDGRFVLRVDGRVIALDPATGDQTLIAGCESHDEVSFGAALDEPWEVDGHPVCADTGEPVANWVPIISIDRSELMLWDADTSEWQVVDPNTGSVSASGDFALPAQQPHIQFTDDWIFAMPNFESAVVLDRQTGDEVASFRGAFLYMDTSGDGTMIAGADSGIATFVDTSELTSWDVVGDFGDVRAVAFSPSDRLLAVGDELSIVVIDVEARRQVRSIPVGRASGLHWLDEATLLVGARDPSRWISVSLQAGRLVSDAAAGLTRGFTEVECQEYALHPCPTLEELRRG